MPRGPGGFAVALLTCCAIVALVVLITPRRHGNSLPVLNYGADLAALRAAAPYPPYAPEGLPPRWRTINSRLTGTGGDGPVAWHLGFATPTDELVALAESDERPDDFVIRMTSVGTPDGDHQVGGVTWERYYRESKDQRSLVHRLDGVTLVVTGTSSYDELAVLAGSLRAR